MKERWVVLGTRKSQGVVDVVLTNGGGGSPRREERETGEGT